MVIFISVVYTVFPITKAPEIYKCNIGPVQCSQRKASCSKAVSNRDPLPDWVRDLNYVRSQALQIPS